MTTSDRPPAEITSREVQKAAKRIERLKLRKRALGKKLDDTEAEEPTLTAEENITLPLALAGSEAEIRNAQMALRAIVDDLVGVGIKSHDLGEADRFGPR